MPRRACRGFRPPPRNAREAGSGDRIDRARCLEGCCGKGCRSAGSAVGERIRGMSEMWDSVAPGWEANAGFVDEQLALATEAMLDAAGIGAGDAVLDLAAGPGGAGLAAATRVGAGGSVVVSDVAAEMVAVAARRSAAAADVSTPVF